ncbi:molybdate ABC transporter substrate-binding protein [Nesterenkonia muleiensis]|uniref:molybdate ABC transporter substrate-binding protein n=1 Tax=Nesterenkonia muleiensis TaxID=2282648 RepID=UPI000E70B21D|nr:molybdate ABC transporter substrate-binding protein [Nesterenkonia muleiensis]
MKRTIALAAAGGLALTACADNDDEGITVFAAASLHEVFEEIGERYTEETGVEVEFTFAGSSGLVEQLENGAPADVLATADEANMDAAAGSGLVSGDPELFAENYLVIVTPAGNPGQVSGLEDLDDEDLQVVICAEQVPCGAATQRISAAAGVQISPVSEETSVTDVLGRVRNGEADAGLVYATDALQAGDEVETFEIDGAQEDPNLYPIALLESADAPGPGQEFVDFVIGDEQARQILEDAGFTEPR